MSASNAILTINLDAVRVNYNIFRALAAEGSAVAGVVKADGYGLGMERIAQALYQEGCKTYFVATPEEGMKLRCVLSDVEIFVLGGFWQGAEDLYAMHNLLPVLNSSAEIKRYSGFCNNRSFAPAAALHIDTGMNRLGMRVDGLDSLPPFNPVMVMSHFVCADEKWHPMNERQFRIFESAADRFPRIRKSLSNSAGAFRDVRYHFDLLRPGMALYGLNPTPEARESPMHPVVGLQARVLQTGSAQAGEFAGYNATYCFEKSARLAVAALGYADGLLRSLSNSGALYWKDYRCPIRGRVSMDLVIVDLSAVPENETPCSGDWMEVIGPNQSADELAQSAGTIGYEILTSLGGRYERRYTG